jgi:putative N-acetyltransferase (TIGR04045 family)
VTGVSSPSTAALEGAALEGAALEGAAIDCRVACGTGERDAHFELRRAVFVREQGLFESDDRDARDADPATLHAIGLVDGEPRGAVRLYRLDPSGREWKGDRLAVMPGFRTHHLGAELVRFAVGTAGWLGGERMIAHVQLPNVRFFRYLGWTPEGDPEPFHEVEHQLMWIGLGPPSGM